MTDQQETPESESERGPNKSLLFAGGALVVAVLVGGAWYWQTTAEATQSGRAATSDPAGAPAIPEFDTAVERGQWVFERRACRTCHGEAGVGGVVNENYVLGTVPALNEMADRLMLFGPEDADIAIAMLDTGVDPASRADDPPFAGYDRFVAQYEVVLGVINNGATSGKADQAGPEPPLQMPAWGAILSEEEKRSVIAYLISLYDWEGDDEADEAEEADDDEADDGADPYADDGDDTAADPYADDDETEASDPYADDDGEAEDDPYADEP